MSRGAPAPADGARKVAGDEFVHAEARRPRPAVRIMAFKVEGALVCKELAHRVDNEAIGANRIGRKGVDDDAVALAAFVVAQPRAAVDPLLRQSLGRQRPTQEPSDPSVLIDDKEKVSASDLIEEHLRPFAELKFGEGRLLAEKLDRQAQGGRGVFRSPGAQAEFVFRPPAVGGGRKPGLRRRGNDGLSVAADAQEGREIVFRGGVVGSVTQRLTHGGLGAFDRALTVPRGAAENPHIRPLRSKSKRGRERLLGALRLIERH